MRLTINDPNKILELVGFSGEDSDTLTFDIDVAKPPLFTTFGAWVNRTEVSGDWWIDAQALESDMGRQLGLYRTYHPAGNLPTSTREREVFGTLGMKGLINWKPTENWAEAASGALNSPIAIAARALRDLGNPVDLAIYHEPADNMSASNTVAAYRGMWANVDTVFAAEGASNVRFVYVATGAENNHAIEEQLFPPGALVAAYDPYVPNATVDPVDHFDAKYQWWIAPERPWHGLPIGWAEWGIGLNPYTPTPERQVNAFLDLASAFDADAWPLLEFVNYFDSGYAKLQAGAKPAFAALANLPRFIR